MKNVEKKLSPWFLFTELDFSPYQKYNSNKDRSDDFLPNLTIPNTPKVLIDYLKGFQIFTLGVNGLYLFC